MSKKPFPGATRAPRDKTASQRRSMPTHHDGYDEGRADAEHRPETTHPLELVELKLGGIWLTWHVAHYKNRSSLPLYSLGYRPKTYLKSYRR